MKGYRRRYVIEVALQGEEVGKAGPALSAEEVDVCRVTVRSITRPTPSAGCWPGFESKRTSHMLHASASACRSGAHCKHPSGLAGAAVRWLE